MDAFTASVARTTTLLLTWEWPGDDAEFNVYLRQAIDAPRQLYAHVATQSVIITNNLPLAFISVTTTNQNGETE
jgi:hypothetical protein